MFDSLSDKLEQTVKRLRGHGRISERNIEDAVREVRVALLEADVQFQVASDFTERVRAQSLGAEVLASLTPEQHFIKIVRAELTHLMGERTVDLDLAATPPVVVMLVGLKGPGKTTTVGKLAQYLKRQRGRTPYLVPADVTGPAADRAAGNAWRGRSVFRFIRHRPAPMWWPCVATASRRAPQPGLRSSC